MGRYDFSITPELLAAVGRIYLYFNNPIKLWKRNGDIGNGPVNIFLAFYFDLREIIPGLREAAASQKIKQLPGFDRLVDG